MFVLYELLRADGRLNALAIYSFTYLYGLFSRIGMYYVGVASELSHHINLARLVASNVPFEPKGRKCLRVILNFRSIFKNDICSVREQSLIIPILTHIKSCQSCLRAKQLQSIMIETPSSSHELSVRPLIQ